MLSTSPLRRAVGVFGLLLLIPIALRLFRGELSLGEAGQRAGITFLAVLVCVRVLGSLLTLAADAMERAAFEDE